MPTYSVVGKVYASKYLGEFEADSPEDAVEKALASDAAAVCLCHQCSDQAEDAEISDAIAELVEKPK